MNTPEPCNNCLNLYYDCLKKDDPSDIAECKKKLPIGNVCPYFEKEIMQVKDDKLELKLYEIINPSDPYTLLASNFAAACVAICLLGEGNYGLTEIDGDNNMPVFIFGGHDEWFMDQFGMNFKDTATSISNLTIAEILDSVLIGTPHERKVYELGILLVDPDKRNKFKDIYLEEKCSSINNIGKHTKELAKKLRQQVEKEATILNEE